MPLTASRWAAENSSNRRATADLHSIAKVNSRPCKADRRRIIIHSETSKLPLPVLASRPDNPLKLDLVGRLVASREPCSALVTQGGLPITRMGSLDATNLPTKSN